MNAQNKNPQEKQDQPKVPNQPEQAPVQEPTEQKDVNAPMIGNEKGSAGPYILAWLLGVPASLLIVIALFRAVF